MGAQMQTSAPHKFAPSVATKFLEFPSHPISPGRKPEQDEFFHDASISRHYVRLRYGEEYSGGWVITSPRNVSGVSYELHSACLARSPIEAVNKMSMAGYTPSIYPPRLPKVADFYTHKWEIMMYKDTNFVP